MNNDDAFRKKVIQKKILETIVKIKKSLTIFFNWNLEIER